MSSAIPYSNAARSNKRLLCGRVGDTCIVHEDVDAPERAHRFVDEPAQFSFLTEVGSGDRGTSARSAGAPCLLKRFHVRRGQNDAMACAEEGQRHHASKATSRTGHECYTLGHT